MRRLLWLAACAALAVAPAACGGGGAQSRRDAVNAYFDRVGGAQAELAAQQGALDHALRAFSTGGNSREELAALARVEAQLRSTRGAVAAIEPPPAARPLHRDLLRLLDTEARTAAEISRTAVFLPQLDRALRPLTPAAARASRDLRRARSYDAIDAAFVRYRTVLVRTVAALDALTAPEVLRPAVAGRRSTLARAAALCARIHAALAVRDVAKANAAIHAVFAVDPATDRVRAAELAAERAYNDRLGEIQRLATAVEQDRLRLVEAVG